MTTVSEKSIVILPLVEQLLAELHESQIPYCHWKSNIDLDKSFRGLGDLDLLVDRRYSSSFNQIALSLGFKRAVVDHERQFPGIEDYLGWDRQSDLLIHLHVHYQLVLGATYVKSIHLPWEQAILRTSQEQGPIRISAPEPELLLFVVRSILKVRLFDLIRGWKGSARNVEELRYLSARATTIRSFSEFLTASRLSREFFEKLFVALESQSAWRAWWRKKQLQRRLRPFQRCGWSVRFARPLVARLKRRWRAIRGGVHGGMPASGGMVLAVVGCDGSGKSTMVQELTRWLNTHYAVQTYHLGKPRRSRLNYIMLRFAGVLGRLSIKVHSARVGILADLANVLSHLSVARDRRRDYSKIRKSVGRGQIAVVDRFPLRGVNMDSMWQIMRFGESQNALLRWLTARTARCYQAITAPDLLLVLQVSLDVARARRPENSEAYLVSRIEAVDSIVPAQNVVMLDGEKDLSHVLTEAKTAVWRWL